MRTLTDEKKNAILAAASAVFQEQGYERASMNEVARRAGGSKATLYNYFPSKEALFEAVVRLYSTSFLTRAAEELAVDNAAGSTLEETLRHFGEGLLSVLTTDRQALQLYRVVVGEAGHSNIGELFLISGVRDSMESLASLMQKYIDAGVLRAGAPMVRAKQFSALVTAEVDDLLLQKEMRRYSDAQIVAMVQDAVALFMMGAKAS